MMMLSKIPFSFGRRLGDVAPVVSFDPVMPRLGTASPQLVWAANETNGVPLGRWSQA